MKFKGHAVWYLLVAIPILLWGLWLYWRFRPYDILQVKSIKILTLKVQPGGHLIYDLDYCKSAKYDALQGLVQYSFIDSVIFNVTGAASGRLASGCNTSREVVAVPIIPAGKYKLGMTRSYLPNVVRIISIYAESDRFEVLPLTATLENTTADVLKYDKELVEMNNHLLQQNRQLLQALKAALK